MLLCDSYYLLTRPGHPPIRLNEMSAANLTCLVWIEPSQCTPHR
jgi:hypothetical protein